MGVYKTACRGCHGGCLFDVTVDNGRVTKAVPSEDGPLNHGRGCMKGRSIMEQMYHPDRLLYPQKRVGPRGGGKWQRITWDEAYDTIVQRMNRLIDQYGPQCISSLTGTGRHHLPYFTRLTNAIGTPNGSTAGGLICLGPRRTAAAMTSGLFCGVDYYGPTRPGGILVWGANPAVSGADGELQWLIKDAVEEGIPMLVVDPKPTELARRAALWLRIRPGTDGALALGLLNLIISQDLYDHEFVERYTYGFAALKERCQEYPLDKVAEITWIPKEQILAAARWIAETKPLGLEQGCAFEQSVNAMDTCRAILMLPAITGNYDVPGGFVESMEIAPAGLPLSNEIPQDKKDLGLSGGFPFTKHDVFSHPYLMLEAIRTGKPYKIRGLFVNANNTLLSMADAKHTYESLKNIEFMVYMDIFMNPTAELADIVLPAALWPEVDCVFAMPEFGDQVLLSQQKLVQVGECKMDEEFFIELCRRAGWNYGYESRWEMMEAQLQEMARRRPELKDFTLDDLRAQGYLAPERTYYNYKSKGFETPTGKFEFYSTAMAEQGADPLPAWREPPETPVSCPELAEAYPLVLTTGGRQQPYFISNNRQIRSLRKAAPFPLVRMSPETAERYGIREGDWVYIETRRGRITQKARLEPGWDLRVVNCDFGWWYPEAGAPGYGWDESNVNVLTIGQAPYDPYLGSYQFRGLLCRIYKNEDCHIEERYYSSRYYLELPEDVASDCVVLDHRKCILCGECVRVCEAQGIGALRIGTQSGVTKVSALREGDLSGSGCVGCGQCHAVCPTGAMGVKSDIDRVKEALKDPETLTVAQIAPSVRVSGGTQGENSMARLVGGLKQLGFDRVYDTVFGADLTVRAEAEEFLERQKAGGPLPLMTSCCPAWVQYCQEQWPQLAANLSTCRSPHQMLAAAARSWHRKQGGSRRLVLVSVMPCTAKKAEILRPESHTDGVQDVDIVLTASELWELLRQAGAEEAPPAQADRPFAQGSGGGTIFGAAGGVAEAVLRYLAPELGLDLRWIAASGVRGEDGVRRVELSAGDKKVRLAVVSGLGNARRLMEQVASGAAQYDLIEVMACPGGCVMGGGQTADPYGRRENRTARSQGLYRTDQAAPARSTQENQELSRLWEELIAGQEQKLLHRNPAQK